MSHTAAHGSLYLRGLSLSATAALLWSTAGVITRLVHCDEWTTVFWRAAFATLALFGWLAVRRGRGALAGFLVLGAAGWGAALLLGLDSVLFVVSIMHTTVTSVVVIMAAAPLFAALFGWLLLRESVALRTWLAMLGAGLGIGVIVWRSVGGGTLGGDLVAISLPVVFTLAIVLLRGHRDVDLVPVVAVASAMVAVATLPLARPGGLPVTDYLLLAWFGMGEYAASLLLFTAAARHVPAAQVLMVGMLETVLAPVWTWLAVGERPGAWALGGGTLVIASVMVLAIAELRAAGRQT